MENKVILEKFKITLFLLRFCYIFLTLVMSCDKIKQNIEMQNRLNKKAI